VESNEAASMLANIEASLDPAAALSLDAATQSEARLRALYEISHFLLQQREPHRILEEIHQALLRHLAPDRLCLLAVDADGSLRAVTAHQLHLAGPPAEWSVSHTALARARTQGVAVLVSDALRDPELTQSGSVHRLNIHSILAVPLSTSPVRGLIYLDNQAGERSFTREDLEFVTALAGYAAIILGRAEERLRTEQALEASREQLHVLEDELLRHRIIGRSPALLAAYDSVKRFARAGARVVLRGETGTGKELFARAYAANSLRAGKPYIPVPIPALAPSLVESELFGHVKGAFSEASRDRKGRLELADTGVLFLDEIGDVDLALQPKLLRFLDSGELYRVGDNQARHVDALVVSATNRPIEKLVTEGRFRDDFFARLGHVVVIPPLRERREDIPLLVQHFLSIYARGAASKTFSDEALAMLAAYRWEFNVRQLQQVVERAVCLVDGDHIEPEHLPDYISEWRGRTDAPPPSQVPATDLRPLQDVVQAVEREHIARVLAATKGNRRRAIRILQMAPATFYRRLQDLGLSDDAHTEQEDET
jgi:two-component system, NtrC family, response regulator AtoC